MSSPRVLRCTGRHYHTLSGPVTTINLELFQKWAFLSGSPLIITAPDETQTVLPAASKWFTTAAISTLPGKPKVSFILQEYLAPYALTLLPYELLGSTDKTLAELLQVDRVPNIVPSSSIQLSDRFHHFNAPLSLLFHSRAPGLYVAQASLLDLPIQLQQDLPTPEVVKRAGKGDIYGANLWLGNPPTYTPLHKDPNPNLFVQLAGRKRVRLYNPQIGYEIFKKVRAKVDNRTCHNGTIRGKEMMEGIERVKLEEAVWMTSEHVDNGAEVELGQGDSLFIPKGWWHSIKSIRHAVSCHSEVVASVNWWFR